MSTQAKATERFVIVAGIDASPSAAYVIDVASRFAASIPGAELHIVHVLDGFEPAPRAEIPNPWSGTETLERGRAYMEQIGAKAAQSFGGRIVGHLAVGEPWREIVQFAERLTSDLVVVGSEGRTGIRRLALGSVSELVVRKAKCPVVVARKTDYHTSDVPEIEPACPDCLAKQRETGGQTLWCDRHAKGHRVRGKTHYEIPESFAVGSSMLRPE